MLQPQSSRLGSWATGQGEIVLLEESEEESPHDNLERLRSHLKKDTLAEKLVSARIAAGAAELRPALRKVMTDRIEELRRGYELPDQQA